MSACFAGVFVRLLSQACVLESSAELDTISVNAGCSNISSKSCVLHSSEVYRC